ncbi:hypothetical protein [Prosthecobacter sp.]|uniref:hypothetical protein n=1 Tax=Prosthecobacter sp. TaxID=1965333 RepID=UPI002ABC820A|nr:hypothetical protein [Prosthecobacter sp.]MDZ4403347.1 hypothetical protein [Prosthecobacter sp.]
MKPSACVGLFILVAGNLLGIDPFYQPEEWDRYQERVLRLREHEKLAFIRPDPGKHPIVALQTLILREFKVKDVNVYEAFEALADGCGSSGVSVTFYVDSSARHNESRISYEAPAGETVAKTLGYLMMLTRTHIHLSGNHILVANYDTLNPYVVSYGVYVLSEKAADYCRLPKPDVAGKEGEWMAAEKHLMEQGIPFPAGTYADYRPDIHSLVVINTDVTRGSLRAWLREIENRVIIETTKDQGIVAMDGFKIETRSYPVSDQTAQRMHGWLMDKKNKLVPFAHDTADLVSYRTTISNNQTGSAAWLDVKSKRLWVRNRPEDLDDFEKGWEAWLARLEAHPAYGVKPSKK